MQQEIEDVVGSWVHPEERGVETLLAIVDSIIRVSYPTVIKQPPLDTRPKGY